MDTMNEMERSSKETNDSGGQTTTASTSTTLGTEFVLIPCDGSRKMQTMILPNTTTDSNSGAGSGDRIPAFVKPHFADGRTVDVSLVQEQAQKTIATSSPQIQNLNTKDNISAANLNAIAAQGSVEVFPLVRPAPTNSFQGVYLYMDEMGMLKKLPLNMRAVGMAHECGLPPSQKFYGDVFVGRVQTKPQMENVSFRLGQDTDRSTAEWMQRAPHENREWHDTAKEIAAATTAKKKNNKDNDKDFVAKPASDEVAMTWEQNEEELEIRIPFPNVDVIDKAKVKVSFLPKAIEIKYDKVDFLMLQPLYNPIQAGDGCCTWTIEKPNTLIVTVEVSDPSVAWPQLTLS